MTLKLRYIPASPGNSKRSRFCGSSSLLYRVAYYLQNVICEILLLASNYTLDWYLELTICHILWYNVSVIDFYAVLSETMVNETRFLNNFVEKRVLFYAWSPDKSGFVWLAALLVTSKTNISLRLIQLQKNKKSVNGFVIINLILVTHSR